MLCQLFCDGSHPVSGLPLRLSYSAEIYFHWNVIYFRFDNSTQKCQ